MTPLFKRILAIGLGILAIVIIAIVWLVFNRQNKQDSWLPFSSDSNSATDVVATDEDGNASSESIAYEDLEWRTNSQGKKWALSSDESDFVVSSKDDGGIRFWEGNIRPLKVAPGMTQTMKIVVSSPNGIDSVIAMIETDNGTTTVELKKTGVLAARDLDDRHGLYTVDENNVLAINTTEEAAAYRLALAQAEDGSGPVNAALAASGEREIFEGSWEVKDTSVRDYVTIFIARDAAGQEKSNILSWSDPCYNNGQVGVFWPNSGDAVLSDLCSLSSTYGVDGGNLTIAQDGILNLQSGAILAFNPGKQVNLQANAQINLGSNASIQKKYLWAQDNDSDNYAVSGQRWVSTSATVLAQGDGGWMSKLFSFFTPAQAQTGNVVRQSTIVSTEDDCYDSNANAFPGQTSYFSNDRGDGLFDYDCDGNESDSFNVYGTAPDDALLDCLPTQMCGHIKEYDPYILMDCKGGWDAELNPPCLEYYDSTSWQDSTHCWIGFPPACGELGDYAYMGQTGNSEFPSCVGVDVATFTTSAPRNCR